MSRNLIRLPRFYPVEYVLMLVSSLVVLFAASALGALIINYWLDDAPSVWADLNILAVLSVLIVALPLHLLVYVRVRRSDRTVLSLLSQRIANTFLGIYLFVTVAVAVGLTVWLLVLWLNAYLGAGAVDTQLYIATWSLLFAIGLFKYAAWHFLRTRDELPRPVYYVLTIGILGVGLIVLGFVYPVPAYRDAARDFVKENDLRRIELAVGQYVNEHEKLPENLHALDDLDKATERRLGDYRYTSHGDTALGIFGYELCADFATSGHDFGFPGRKAGEQCEPFIAISGPKLQQGLAAYVEGVENGVTKLEQGVAQFLQGAETAVTREVEGVESSIGGQLGQLERYLEGVEGGSQALQQEMQRLEQDITSSAGISGKLEQDFATIEKFFYDLICGLDPNCNPNNK